MKTLTWPIKKRRSNKKCALHFGYFFGGKTDHVLNRNRIFFLFFDWSLGYRKMSKLFAFFDPCFEFSSFIFFSVRFQWSIIEWAKRDFLFGTWNGMRYNLRANIQWRMCFRTYFNKSVSLTEWKQIEFEIKLNQSVVFRFYQFSIDLCRNVMNRFWNMSNGLHTLTHMVPKFSTSMTMKYRSAFD